jgi:hypothetical protein
LSKQGGESPIHKEKDERLKIIKMREIGGPDKNFIDISEQFPRTFLKWKK